MNEHAAHTDLEHLKELKQARDRARAAFFAHADPGSMTPAETEAWVLEHEAYELLLKAAQVRLRAEATLLELLVLEALDGEA